MKEVSVVIPVYNSDSTLGELVKRLTTELASKFNYEIVLVNDGSHDRSHQTARSLALGDSRIKFVSFRKNFGQQNAILAGLRECEGRVCVVMDDDLQNPPEEIHKLLAEMERGYDFVFGVPDSPKHSFFRVLGSRIMCWSYEVLLNKPKHLRPKSFTAVSLPVVREIIEYQGGYPYLPGQILRLTTNGINVRVKHLERKVGRSHYGPRRLISLSLTGVTSFSVLPLRLAALAGVLLAIFGFFGTCWIIVRKLSFGGSLEGWPLVYTGLSFFSGVQLVALGLMGEYVGRTFMLLNETPQFSVLEKVNCSTASQS